MAERQPTEERRRQIADAALRIIAENGLRRFTAAELGRVVGIADGTIFRHFRNKQEIVAAAVERMGEILFADRPPENDDPLERLGLFFLQRVEMLQAHPYVAQMMFSNQLSLAAGSNAAAEVRRLQERSRSFVRDCLEEAGARGLLQRDLPVDDLLLLVLGALQSLVLLSREGMLEGSPVVRAQRIWTTLEHIMRR